MDLTQYQPTAISTIKDRFELAKYDPTNLIKVALETIEEITEGKATLVDASNPMVMLLEMGSVLSANCIQENVALLRRQYAELATTEDELYHHMSDEDFLNRFASPATASFTIAMQIQDMVRQMVYDPSENAHKLIFPRDTTIVVDGVTFTLLYPIVIRRSANGSIQVSYDPLITNPLYALNNTIIDASVRRGTEQEDWLFFSVNMEQVQITPQYFVIDKTYNFKKKVIFPDSFYYARAFYQNENTNGQWIEIKTTHTDQVFDVRKPTVVLKVLDQEMQIEIPIVYMSSGVLSGQLRIDVYTTKGELSMNLRNYRQDAFVVTLKAVDEARDLNAYTAAMGDVSYYAYSLESVVGGKKELTFDALRERVIYNAVGPQNIPITNVQLEAEAENNGFEIVKNIDVLTNRVFLATRKLPTPSNVKLITPANIGMVTFAAQLESLLDNDYVTTNGHRMTIASKAVWLSENSQLRLLNKAEVSGLKSLGQTAMIALVNASQYFYTPFYYVLDASGDEFEIRSYALDQPYAKNLNFIRQNQSLQLFVNTGSYQLTKTLKGYALRVVTKSGSYYRGLSNAEVGIQLAFNPKNETTYAYINGVLESTREDGERIYLFDIETNHDINSDNLINVTNSTVQGITEYEAWIDLETTFNLLHYTTSVTQTYAADETNQLLGRFMLPSGAAGNSHEKLTLHMGDALSSLWRRSRSYSLDTVYRLHPENVPLYYEKDVFAVDQDTGSILTISDAGDVIYTILHHEGDPVIDIDGNQVYRYRQGDVIRDELNQPVKELNVTTGREMDLLVIDGRYLFADDEVTIAYRDEIEATLTGWIINDVSTLQKDLLEQTRIFFYPKTTLGMLHVYTENGGEDYLAAEQSFVVSLYVKAAVYGDSDIRERLRALTVKLLDSLISQQVVNMTEIFDALKELYGPVVAAFSISGLGGERNYQYVEMGSRRNKLCLKKQLIAQADRTMIVQDAVDVEFKLVG